VLRQPTPTVMSLMGWSSESMAARYQHVTDALHSQVASQVGELIWDSAAGNDDQARLMVRRASLAVILAAVEECIAGHRGAGACDGRPVAPPQQRPARAAHVVRRMGDVCVADSPTCF
jgi:hypothetical protein